MRRLPLLTILGLASLLTMACSLFGFVQTQTQAPEPNSTSTQVFTAPEAPVQTEEVTDKAQAQNTLPTATLIPTTDPIDAAKSCLANVWQVDGLSDYMMAAIPPDLAEEYQLEHEETSGEAFFIVAPDGQITLLANNLVLTFSAQAYVFSVPVTVRINGSAAGHYEVDGNTLTITDFDTTGLEASAQALGEDLVDPAQITSFIPFVSPPYNKATYSCQGNVLELELSGYPGDLPPLVFQAIE